MLMGGLLEATGLHLFSLYSLGLVEYGMLEGVWGGGG